jgi:hypothetical protein
MEHLIPKKDIDMLELKANEGMKIEVPDRQCTHYNLRVIQLIDTSKCKTQPVVNHKINHGTLK